jgi:hypothetical protein
MAVYLEVGDYVALVGYFAVVIGIGIWVNRRLKQAFLINLSIELIIFFIKLVIMPKQRLSRWLFPSKTVNALHTNRRELICVQYRKWSFYRLGWKRSS